MTKRQRDKEKKGEKRQKDKKKKDNDQKEGLVS